MCTLITVEAHVGIKAENAKIPSEFGKTDRRKKNGDAEVEEDEKLESS